jgi:polar amino acid transport system permease protein
VGRPGTLWQGFLTSVQVSALAIFFGTVVGVVAGLVLTYGKFWMRAPFRFYVDLIRGTPVFVLVLACFYMAPALGWQISAFQAGALGLTLFCGSHVAEIVRGALQALPRGQMEASKAIGLTFYPSVTCCCPRRCGRSCRPGSTRPPKSSRLRPCCR